MVTITRRDLCRLALLSLMVAFDGRSYRPLAKMGVLNALSTLGHPSPLVGKAFAVFPQG